MATFLEALSDKQAHVFVQRNTRTTIRGQLIGHGESVGAVTSETAARSWVVEDGDGNRHEIWEHDWVIRS